MKIRLWQAYLFCAFDAPPRDHYADDVCFCFCRCCRCCRRCFALCPNTPSRAPQTQVLPPELLSDTRFIGSSSGALLAVLAATGVVQQRPHDIIHKAAALCHRYQVYSRRSGLFGVWGGLLRELLDDLLPADASELCSGGRAAILCTAYPWLYSVLLTDYGSREDVISAVLASAHIPLLMDGRWARPLPASAVAVTSRGRMPAVTNAIDGNWWRWVSGVLGCVGGGG